MASSAANMASENGLTSSAVPGTATGGGSKAARAARGFSPAFTGYVAAGVLSKRCAVTVQRVTP